MQEPILKIADHISHLVESKPIGIAEANVISMRKNSIEWVRGQDGMTNKLVIKYKGVIGV